MTTTDIMTIIFNIVLFIGVIICITVIRQLKKNQKELLTFIKDVDLHFTSDECKRWNLLDRYGVKEEEAA